MGAERATFWSAGWRGAAVFLLVATLSSTALADTPAPAIALPLDLDWNGPAECPGRETVLDRIDSVLGEAPRPPGAPRVSAHVSVSRSDDGRWHGLIVTADESSPESSGERSLDSPTCSSLTTAISLVLAIRVKPGLWAARSQTTPINAPAPPPPPPPPPPTLPSPLVTPTLEMEMAPALRPALMAAGRPEPLRASESSRDERPVPSRGAPPAHRATHRLGSFVVGSTFVGTAGELPSADVSAELSVAYVAGNIRFELHGETGLTQEVGSSRSAATSFRAAGGGLRGCYGPSWRALEVFGCLDAELDAMWGAGQGFTPSYTPRGAWPTLGALVGARLRLTRRIGLHTFAEALAPLERPKFVTETSAGSQLEVDGVVHQPSALWGRAGIGIDVNFFDGCRDERSLTSVCLDHATSEPSFRPPMNDGPRSLAFEEVYDENVDFVWRVVARLGVRPSSVEDVAQEVFVVVHRKLGEFEGAASIRTWLFHITRLVVQEHRRTVRRKEPPPGTSEFEGEPIEVERVPSGSGSSPEVAAARAQAVRLLHAILEDMDDQKREVFVLAELEQLPAPEIAEAIGINVNTVYSRLRHARAAFNEALVRHQAHQRNRSIR